MNKYKEDNLKANDYKLVFKVLDTMGFKELENEDDIFDISAMIPNLEALVDFATRYRTLCYNQVLDEMDKMHEKSLEFIRKVNSSK